MKKYSLGLQIGFIVLRETPYSGMRNPQEGNELSDADWASEVLQFWFGELGPDDWFGTKPSTDETIRTRFGALYERLFRAAPSTSFDSADKALAAILVFDQFSRNMFRGQPRAFASDDLALMIARQALDRGYDAKVPEGRRIFFYMPFMHSENAADQEHCVALTAALPGDFVKYAREHRDIIASYGRFPHRNRALGRKNTRAEESFLAGHEGFGQ